MSLERLMKLGATASASVEPVRDPFVDGEEGPPSVRGGPLRVSGVGTGRPSTHRRRGRHRTAVRATPRSVVLQPRAAACPAPAVLQHPGCQPGRARHPFTAARSSNRRAPHRADTRAEAPRPPEARTIYRSGSDGADRPFGHHPANKGLTWRGRGSRVQPALAGRLSAECKTLKGFACMYSAFCIQAGVFSAAC